MDTQRHGAVGLFVAEKEHLDRYKGGTEDYKTDMRTIMKNTPVRWSAMHVFLPEGPFFSLLKALLVVVFTGKDERVRMKFYSGGLNKVENAYQLMSYGISIQELPVTHSGTLKKKYHAQWIKVRKLLDEEREKGSNGVSSFVEHPGVYDVLFRRGGNNSQFGNLLFQESMLKELSAYNSVHNHFEKRQIRDRIIQSIKSKGGRFLEFNKDAGVWIEILDETVVHNKVISAINDLFRMIAARDHAQRNDCDTEMFLSEAKRRKVDDNLCHLG